MILSKKRTNEEKFSAAWPRELKRRCYGNYVITIAWSRFNSHPRRTRCCVLG